MAEYMTLLGSEAVSRAAGEMTRAAQEMQTAASWTEESLFRHRQFLDDWLLRFEQALEKLAAKGE